MEEALRKFELEKNKLIHNYEEQLDKLRSDLFDDKNTELRLLTNKKNSEVNNFF